VYTKEEASAVRAKFWTSLGKYLKPIPNAEGETINWINYKTGVNQVRVKADAQNGFAYLMVEISGEENTRNEMLAAFKRLDFSWHTETVSVENEWNDGGKQVHQLITNLEDVSVFRETDWPAIISFLKANLIAFDVFWCENKEFINLCI
jgi:hypothetical protein